jgi:1,2-dihydroxy-3-keto-5-methylthiopentene dioxygenase
MAIVTLIDAHKTLSDDESIRECLKRYGIEYERWILARGIDVDSSTDEILDAYSAEIDQLKARGGYVTADVIDVSPQTPGLDEMLAKFSREHWHDEDEVRFVISGHGLFHINGSAGVVAIEVEAGDLIRVPSGTQHWFNLCSDRRIRAIRLFQEKSGWTPQYTDSDIDRKYEPVCLGTTYLPQAASHR